jgi:hypothetical protein
MWIVLRVKEHYDYMYIRPIFKEDRILTRLQCKFTKILHILKSRAIFLLQILRILG